MAICGQEIKRAAWRRARKAADTCSIYILDASDVAARLGVPRCQVQNFAIDPRKSMVLPNPARLPFPLPEKDSRIQDASEMYPWKVPILWPLYSVYLDISFGANAVSFLEVARTCWGGLEMECQPAEV